MKNIITIFTREIRAYFNSAIAYIFIIVFLLISTGLFMAQFFMVGDASMRGYFFMLPLILCVFLPAVTMRLWAEDRKGNTLELLLTFPAKTHELVLGKFFASLLFYIISLLATLPLPIMIASLGNPDLGAIFSQYLGAALMGSFFLALGIFISGFCKDQIVSFIVAMLACFAFFLLGTDFAIVSIDGWLPGLGSFLRNSLGMTQHFATCQKGVIDIRDLLYFIIGITVCLMLNGFWLETRLRPKAKTIFTTTALISIVIFALVNFIFVDLPIGRFDLTEGKTYTISKATGEILKGLKTPVTAKLFISPANKMPGTMKMLERDIKDKLDEFKVVAKGNFNYKVFHMETASVEDKDEETLEKSVEKKGIRPFQVRSIEADEMGVKLIYSAMSIAYKEKPDEIIPALTTENISGLEYTLISKIYRMTLTEAPAIALVAPYTEKAIDPQMRALLKQFGQRVDETMREDEYEMLPGILGYEGYEVARIKLSRNEPIPDGTKTLIVVEPQELNERQRFEINRFLVNGGSVFIAAQQYDFEYRAVGRGGMQVSARDKKPELNQLLEKWGLALNKDFLMDTQHEVLSISGGRSAGIFPASIPVKLPMQIKVIAEQMSSNISITSRLPRLLYLWGSALTIDSKKLTELKLKEKVLFSSSPEAWETVYHPGTLSAEDIAPAAVEKRKRFPLAVLIEGSFPDAFNGQEVPAWPAENKEGEESYEKPEEKIALSPQPGKLILVGCSKMFTRDLLRQGGHGDLFINSIDVLTLGEKLIGVRTKQPINRSLKRVSSGVKAGWKMFATFFVPVVLCIVGGVRIFLRKRAKWVYAKTV